MDSKTTRDKTPIMRALLMAAVAGLLLFPTVATVNAAETDTVTRYWDGKAFTETKDPLKRFVEFPVTDDGKGNFTHIAPVPTLAGQPRVGQNTATNLDLQAGMLLFGRTKADAIRQIELVLGGIPYYDEARTTAENAINQGDYLSANLALAGTPLEISLYCGDSSSIPWEFHWYLGVPYRADCDANGSFDQLMLGTATRVQPFIGVVIPPFIDSADLLFQTRPLTAIQPTNEWLGMGYGPVAVGSITWSQNQVKITASVNSISPDSTSPWGTITWGLAAGSYASDDKFWVTTGTPGYDSTFYVVTNGLVSSFTTYVDIGWGTSGGSLTRLRVYVSMDSTAGVKRLDIHVPVSGMWLDLQGANVPKSFLFNYEKSDPIWVDSTHSVRKYTLSLDSTYSLYNTELKGSLADYKGPVASFQFVGFPNHTDLVIDPGWNTSSCGDTNSVFAMDLTKGFSSGNSGWFRSFIVDGQTCDLTVQVTGTDLERARIVAGKHDIWKDNDKFLLLGAAVYPFADSKLRVNSGSNWWLDYDGWIQNAGSQSWWYLNRGCPVISCGDYLNYGTTYEQPILWLFNGYFWAIGSNQLDKDVCYPSNMKYLYGVCP